MKIIDAIGVGLIAVGLLMTVLTFLAARGPAAGVQSFAVHEPHSPRRAFAPFGAGGNL